MMRIHEIIERAQQAFADLLEYSLARAPLHTESYVRYLSMQYHLAYDVQSYFLFASAHRALAKRRALRRFLFNFANEEELHYLVAAKDLRALGRDPLPEPIDVTLWHSYFRSQMVERPFVRLGAACILENISGGVARPVVRRALSAPFLDRGNTKFLVLHQHETLPHGEQVVRALTEASLDPAQIDDVLAGARRATVLYLRMAEWALDANVSSHLADEQTEAIDSIRRDEINDFQMDQLVDGPEVAEQ